MLVKLFETFRVGSGKELKIKSSSGAEAGIVGYIPITCFASPFL